MGKGVGMSHMIKLECLFIFTGLKGGWLSCLCMLENGRDSKGYSVMVMIKMTRGQKIQHINF